MTEHQYYCKDCGTEREGLLDHQAVGVGGYSWNCPRCNGTVDSREVEPSGDYVLGEGSLYFKENP